MFIPILGPPWEPVYGVPRHWEVPGCWRAMQPRRKSNLVPPGPLTGEFVSHVQQAKALGNLVNVTFLLWSDIFW